MKYPEFDDYWHEIENYGTRGERFYNEFEHIDSDTRYRIIEWLQASWYCAREVQNEE